MKMQENIPLAPYATLKIGGKARYLVSVRDERELLEALDFAKGKKVPFFILGGGSNVLIGDGGFAGLVIRNEIGGIERRGESVTAGAGEGWDALVSRTVEWGLWGLENLSAIPGTVGASPVQNIGAYGAEARETIESVRAIDSATGRAREFSNAECRFSYRDSFFKTEEGKRYIITSVSFKLSASPKPNLSYKDLKESFAGKPAPSLREIRSAVTKIRSGKFPDLRATGTAGSFWKNPVICQEHYDGLLRHYPLMPSFPAGEGVVKVPLAWILDNVCGLKGYSKGKVGLYKNQPLVLVAESGAKASEALELAREVARLVKEKTGIDIEPEVQYIG